MDDARPLILIAERDPFMRRALRRTLGDRFDLVFVEDGSSVLDHVKTHPPALVILEALLPTLDGFQVCQQLKNSPGTHHIPVLFFTLLWAEERAAQVGADGFLLKPLHKEVLIRTVEGILASALAEQEGED